MDVFKQLRGRARVGVVGSFGAGNLGDELIAAAFLRALSARAPRATPILFSGNPEKAATLFPGVSVAPLFPIFPRRGFLKRARKATAAFSKVDAVAFPGGGLFSDAESFKAPLLWAGQLAVARLLWKPAVAFGQSVGPLSGRLSRAAARFAIRRFSFFGVRDDASKAVVQKVVGSSPTLFRGRDSLFFLPARQPPKSRARRFLFVPRASAPAAALARFREALALLPPASSSCSFFVSFFDERDAALAEEMAAAAGLPFLPLPALPFEALDAIADFSDVVSMRLHPLLAAELCGARGFGLGVGPKGAAAEKAFFFENENAEAIVKRLLAD